MATKMNKTQLRKWRENYISWDAPCLGDGLQLHVHFDEKDDVKRLGARWNPDPSGKGGHWWMPRANLNVVCPIECDIYGEGWSGTILDWLNNHSMVAAQHHPDRVLIQEYLVDHSLDVDLYDIVSQDGDTTMTFRVYEALAIVGVGDTVYQNIDDGRTIWNDMMNVGWRKVISATSEVCS